MLSKEEIENILEVNEDIITYKADKDFRCLTSTEKTLLENNKKIKEYIRDLEANNYEQNNIINSYIKREQKIIKNLEAEIAADKEDLKYNNLTDYGKGCLDEAREILLILKGEENE